MKSKLIKITRTLILICLFSIVHQFQVQSQSISSLEFSNFLWTEKVHGNAVGPGPNYFGLHRKNVFVDRKGQAHLNIRRKKALWSCAELSTDSILSEGLYEVSLRTNRKTIPDNVVIGLFLYDMKNEPSYNEVDIELSQWNKPDNLNGQHVLYADKGMLINRFAIPKGRVETKHRITITHDSVFVNSKISESDSLLFNSAFKRPDGFILKSARFRINLWLTGSEDDPRKKVGIVIPQFKYTALDEIIN